MINATNKMDRASQFWKGIDCTSVGEYIKELKQTLKGLDMDIRIKRLTYTEKRIDELKEIIKEEIKKCKFYFEFSRRKRGEQDFISGFILKAVTEKTHI